MRTEEGIEKYTQIIKNNLVPLILGLLGLIFFVYGLIAILGNSRASENDIVFEGGQEQSLQNETQIKVDVAGAVINSGVYGLDFDARIQDALVAAGGLSEKADRDWVSKNLNLAQKLTDGTKIYIPKKGETEDAALLRQGFGGQEGTASGLVNINIATPDLLDSLPGVGPVTAQKIIDNRPYSTVDDLLSKKVVGEKVFEEIKGKIRVY